MPPDSPSMPPRPLAHLQDVIDSADRIREYTGGLTFEQYLDEPQVRDAVERRFTIIGEALVRLRRDAPELDKRIGAAAAIIGFRNRVVHGYDRLDQAVIWGVIQQHLQSLRDEATDLLADLMNDR